MHGDAFFDDRHRTYASKASGVNTAMSHNYRLVQRSATGPADRGLHFSVQDVLQMPR